MSGTGEVDGFIPIDDRGLNYGDGLFETMRAASGKIPLLPEHIARLQTGCRRIHLGPVDAEALRRSVLAAAADVGDGVVKLLVTRGSGGRGYRPPDQASPRVAVTTHVLPELRREHYTGGIRLMFCKTRIAHSPDTAGLKHLGRLEQVLASRELSDGFAEGLMADPAGHVIEGTRSNLFLVEGGALATPRLDRAGVAGVMRSFVLREAMAMGLDAGEAEIDAQRIAAADEIFLTNSVFGIWPVRAIPAAGWRRERGPVTVSLMERAACLGVGTWAP